MTSPSYPPPPMPESLVWAEILDNSLNAQYLIPYATASFTINFNTVGSYTVLVPYNDTLWNYMKQGSDDFMVRISWRGLFTFGGKCEQPTYTNSVPNASGVSSGSSGNFSGPFITLQGGDYLQILANRICYPDPTKAWTGQLAGDQDVVANVSLETAIKYYVNRNAGPQAIAARRHPLLVVASDQQRGPTVNYSLSFNTPSLNLMDVIRALVAQAYGTDNTQRMGVNITQNPANMNQLLFDVYVVQDRSGTAYFSEQLGNLTSIALSLTDPTCTNALVRGASSFVQANNPSTPWTMTEQYVDDSTETVAANLNTTAQNTLFTGSLAPNMATTASDTPYCIYGRDYNVGDIVTVEVNATDTYTDVVSSATLTADPSQVPILNVVPMIGNPVDPSTADKTAIGQLVTRIKAIEKAI